jgi:hypothetical protein
MFFLEFAHVDGGHVLFAAVEEFGECECGFGFADAAGTDEEEDSDGSIRIRQVCSGGTNAFGNFAESMILSDDALLQFLVESEDGSDFVADHATDGDAGP